MLVEDPPAGGDEPIRQQAESLAKPNPESEAARDLAVLQSDKNKICFEVFWV